MKFIKGLIKFLVILALIIVLILGYLGLIPFLSKLMGTNKPRDLGMEFSQEQYDLGLLKSGTETKSAPSSASASISYEGSHQVIDSFSDDMLTAHAFDKSWPNYPISNVQVRINDDNSCEVSGIIKLPQIDSFLQAMNISQGDYQKALTEASIPIANLPFYAKGMGTASNNSLSIDVSAFEVGRFPVPKGIIDQYQDDLANFGQTVMSRIPGFSVNEARFENGSIYFDGTLPDAELIRD
jgi:hypothetical protein